VSERSPAAEQQQLERRFRVVESAIALGTPPQRISILHPASAEDLIDEEAFETDERLPYWAELWPSARVLGERLLGMSGSGQRLLELGCGSGLVTVCAALAGFGVCASDYYDDALRFARVNAWRNGQHEVSTRLLDWRRLPRSLPRFDAVVASDVLYERPYGALVAQVLARTLAPGGWALIADPGRVGRDDFIATLAAEALTLVRHETVPYVDGKIRQRITLYHVSRSLSP
jgi:predicted nicotinamide N-methyase